MPATSQLDWLISMTAMIVLFWSRATRDLLKSFGWGIAALHRLHAATKLPFPRRPPHSVHRSPVRRGAVLSLPPSPAEAVVVVAEVMVPAEIAAQIARLRCRPRMVRFRASVGKSNKTVSTSWSFTGDRRFESISLQRGVF